MSQMKTGFAQFSNGHIERYHSMYVENFGYRLRALSPEGKELNLYGFASTEQAARRAALNVLTRMNKRTGQRHESQGIEVVSVGIDAKRVGGDAERFLALYWKPKGMPKRFDKALHKRGRYLITGESLHVWHVLIAGDEYRVSKTLGEIVWYDAEGKRLTGGPIFVLVQK